MAGDKGKAPLTSDSTINIDPAYVMTASREAQQEFGDCLAGDHKSTLPEQVKTTFEHNDISNLVKIWESWSEARQERFTEKFGNIASLLKIEIDPALIRAMLQFWDPSYRCFVLNEVDLVPTHEEYAELIQIKREYRGRAFWKSDRRNIPKALARVMITKVEQLADHAQERETNRYETNFFLSFLRMHPNDEAGLNVFALLIYGLVIFPKKLGYVDPAVIELVDHVMYKGDPSTAILAETLLSLNYCRRHQDSRFVGCSQLLYIWMVSHLKCLNCMFMFKDHISDFSKRKVDKKSKQEWVSMFRDFTSKDVIWSAKWMKRENVKYQSEREPWMPLIGLWGAISYLPLLVRRQYGSEQFVPSTQGLDSVEFTYEGPEEFKRAKAFETMWKNKKEVKMGDISESATDEYLKWHQLRVKDVNLPEKKNLSYPVGRDGRDAIMELTIENQRLKDGTKMEELTKEYQQEKKEWERQKRGYNDEAQFLKQSLMWEGDIVKARDNTIKNLKEEHAKQKGEASLLKDKLDAQRKENERLREKLKEAKKLNAGLDQEVRELKRKNMPSSSQSRQGDLLKIQKLEKAVVNLNQQLEVFKQVVQMHVGTISELEEAKKTLDETLEDFKMKHGDATYLKDMWKEAYLIKLNHVDYLLGKLAQGVTQAQYMERKARKIQSGMMEEKLKPSGRQHQRVSLFMEEAVNQYHQVMKLFNLVKVEMSKIIVVNESET